MALAYLIAAVIFGRYLENKKMRTASVAFDVFFVLSLPLLLIMPDVGLLSCLRSVTLTGAKLQFLRSVLFEDHSLWGLTLSAAGFLEALAVLFVLIVFANVFFSLFPRAIGRLRAKRKIPEKKEPIGKKYFPFYPCRFLHYCRLLI